jgi:hypothetical protein
VAVEEVLLVVATLAVAAVTSAVEGDFAVAEWASAALWDTSPVALAAFPGEARASQADLACYRSGGASFLDPGG